MEQHAVSSRALRLPELQSSIGKRLGSSDWIVITQTMVNGFAEATHDAQWIHCDPQRAQAESPYGGPIAHGFLTLSLGPELMSQIFSLPEARLTLNYGLNRVRFPSAVRVGSRVRMHADLVEVTEVAGGVQVVLKETFEIEGEDKPACAAEAVLRFLFQEPGT